ncbi:hypothetical protein ABW19_dt0207910 [Dactylella cylindrospora]|nr:hypothetical protein ABW19_dt0207910 [Dactylella cylindrospora]
MPKRKRSDYEPSSKDRATQGFSNTNAPGDDATESARSIAIQQETIQQKVYHHRIVLKRALKTAKGFEQQKLGKRIKAARKGKGPGAKGKDVKDEVQRLEKELDGLKHVDLTDLATTYLNKTLLKNRKLSRSKYFPPSVAKEAEEHSKLPVPTGPVANVCARLLNANPVKEAVKEILVNLGQLLGIEDGESVNTNKPAREDVDEKRTADQKKVEKKERNEDSDTGVEDPRRPDSESGSGSESESEEAEVLDDDDDVIHPSMLKSLATRYLNNGGTISSDDEDDEDEFDSRIVLSSEDEDEKGEEEDRPRGRSMSITPVPEDQLKELEEWSDEDIDDEDEDEDSNSLPSQQRTKSKPQKQTEKALPQPASGPIKSSSFLPTLMSGYISGSDSDASSASSYNKKSKKGPAEKKTRKNRMGQQARRALAEKKYGAGANHIKKAREDKEAKVKLKEEKRKAWEEKQAKGVHVSWQLKQKEKEEKSKIMKEMMTGATKPLGKKIVFD